MQVFEFHHVEYTSLTFFILVCIRDNFSGTYRIVSMSNDMLGVFLFVHFN